ncbi:hypothetical protein [Sphingomonas quercus]|uniref:ANTAR domain-containing protein n=1 Tax=Sphingomonas quercus TaxID=2842451 RepID=A0ABS6BM88_9SPHN|nr:hypothetical protein [Sphingomonas quercus]MBU3079426.1 hypothetical protein [Sphingomonas quercus]
MAISESAMAGQTDQALSIANTLTQHALDSVIDLKRQIAAMARVLGMLREADIDDDAIRTLMEVSHSLLDRRGDDLAAHHLQLAIDAFGRGRAGPEPAPLR